METVTISTEKQLMQMGKLYTNFKISPSKLTGTLKLNEQFELRMDGTKTPDKWVVFDGINGCFVAWETMTGSAVDVIKSFLDDWDTLPRTKQIDSKQENPEQPTANEIYAIGETEQLARDDEREITAKETPHEDKPHCNYNIQAVISKIDALLLSQKINP